MILQGASTAGQAVEVGEVPSHFGESHFLSHRSLSHVKVCATLDPMNVGTIQMGGGIQRKLVLAIQPYKPTFEARQQFDGQLRQQATLAQARQDIWKQA
eukprot:6211769-Pleurochrysis_carterae.AAC.3